MLKLSLLLLIGINFATAAIAQSSNPYIHSGSIGSTQTAKSDGSAEGEPFHTYPPTKWTGQRFLFLPQPKFLQQFGYQNFALENAAAGLHASYDELVGKLAKSLDWKMANSQK